MLKLFEDTSYMHKSENNLRKALRLVKNTLHRITLYSIKYT